MAGKTGFMVCAGAICQCKFGKASAKFKVLTQKKHYINDSAGVQKLLATHKEIGQPFEPPFFGSCSKLNNNACTVNVTEWDSFYEKSTIETGGHPILDSSKGTCPIGAQGCISIIWHGQVSTPTIQQTENVDLDTIAQINPLANPKKIVK